MLNSSACERKVHSGAPFIWKHVDWRGKFVTRLRRCYWLRRRSTRKHPIRNISQQSWDNYVLEDSLTSRRARNCLTLSSCPEWNWIRKGLINGCSIFSKMFLSRKTVPINERAFSHFLTFRSHKHIWSSEMFSAFFLMLAVFQRSIIGDWKESCSLWIFSRISWKWRHAWATPVCFSELSRNASTSTRSRWLGRWKIPRRQNSAIESSIVADDTSLGDRAARSRSRATWSCLQTRILLYYEH